MGKNTMIRKAIRGHVQTNSAVEKLLPHIVGNVGFVFTKEDLSEIRKKLLENKRVRVFYSKNLRKKQDQESIKSNVFKVMSRILTNFKRGHPWTPISLVAFYKDPSWGT